MAKLQLIINHIPLLALLMHEIAQVDSATSPKCSALLMGHAVHGAEQ